MTSFLNTHILYFYSNARAELCICAIKKSYQIYFLAQKGGIFQYSFLYRNKTVQEKKDRLLV